ncbi:hypothetical protein J6590_029458 [Homalodisca vitripennis]|nr:hypothetical protein J6590_029458 [Homalodisca vitripennis]
MPKRSKLLKENERVRPQPETPEQPWLALRQVSFQLPAVPRWPTLIWPDYIAKCCGFKWSRPSTATKKITSLLATFYCRPASLKSVSRSPRFLYWVPWFSTTTKITSLLATFYCRPASL